MTIATARDSGEIKFKNESPRQMELRPSPLDRANRKLDFVPGVCGPSIIPAPWLPQVERRLRDSTYPSWEGDSMDDGSWLSSVVANAAKGFFQATSDVLPSEPFIYKSANGDLVAEFATRTGKLTSIVGAQFVIAFAVIGGDIDQRELQICNRDFRQARQELRLLTDKLRAGDHVETMETPA